MTTLFAASPAIAAPPDFMAAWEQSDRQLAANDLTAALATLEPLAARRDELTPNSPERAWFALSAARLFALSYQDALAREWERERASAVNYWGRQASSDPAAEERGALSYIRAKLSTPAQAACLERGLKTSAPISFATITAGPPYEVFQPAELRQPRQRATTALDGDASAIPSFFGGLNTTGFKGKEQRAGAFLCNYLLVPKHGAWKSPKGDTEPRYVAMIAATEPAVARGRIARAAGVQVQVYNAEGIVARATWTERSTRRVVKTSARVAGNAARLPAPTTRGTYALEISVGGDRGVVSLPTVRTR